MDLDVTTETGDGRTVLRAVGSIDIASRTRLADAAQAALEGGATDLDVDLSDVSFVDSTGIGTLAGIAGDVADREGTFRILDPSRPVRRILEVAGLSEQWTVDTTA